MYEEYEILGDQEAAKELLIARGRHDVETYALAFFPHFCKYPFNKFHHACFQRWSKDDRHARHADAAPRGSAKSTLKTLIKPIHDVCYGLEKFICIFSSTASQAEGKLKDIKAELMDNHYLHEHFGSFFDTKRVADTKFTVNCQGHKCRFEAYGSKTEVRGIKFGETRPSKLIIDDGEDSEEVNNEQIREKYESWFREVISKLGDENTNIDVTGTILHRKSLLVNILKNPSYDSAKYEAVIQWSQREDLWEKWRQIYGDIDDDGRLEKAQAFYDQYKAEMLRGTRVMWPERTSYLDLMKEMYEIGRPAFMKEMQNNPLASDTQLFTRFWWYVEETEGLRILETGVLVPWKDILGCAGAMDPATGQTKPQKGRQGDYTCILTGYNDVRGRLFVHNDWTTRKPPTQYIKALFELGDLYPYDKFGVETNLYRNLLLPNIQRHQKDLEKERRRAGMKDWAIRIPFYDIENIENKLKRIHTLEPKITNGYILFNKALSQEFKGQLEDFPDPTAHDDGPDALEMLWGLVYKRYGMGALNVKPNRGR